MGLEITKHHGIKSNPALLPMLSYIFGLSYIALKHNTCPSFHSWSAIKKRINVKLNKRVLEYCGSINYSLPGIPAYHTREYVYELIVGIFDRHLKVRQEILSTKKVLSRKQFCQRALIKCVAIEVSGLLKSAGRLFKVFNFDHKANFEGKKVNMALQFPVHSFAVSEISFSSSKNQPVYSSFGDYYKSTSDLPILALENYVRPSRVLEDVDNKNQENEILKERISIYKKISILHGGANILNFLFRLIIIPFRMFVTGNPFLIQTGMHRKWILSNQFFELLKKLEMLKVDVGSIYVMPFNDLGNLRYTEGVCEKLVTYSYSQNIFIFPIYSLFNEKSYSSTDFSTVIADVSLKALLYTGRHAGYTKLIQNIKALQTDINKKFGKIFTGAQVGDSNETPVFLGFENQEVREMPYVKDCIGVFELPPESPSTQYARAICGDRVCDFEYIKTFLSDMTKLCDFGYSIIYKPKYSLANYPVEYRQLLEYMQVQNDGKFVVVSPYIQADSIFNICFLTISMPFTSTYYVAKAYGKPSIYYLPKNSSYWNYDGCASNLIFGFDELLEITRKYNLPLQLYRETSND